MRTIIVRNVNHALHLGLEHLKDYGRLHSSRAGEVLAAPWPVATVYVRPCERVLFDAKRDANPFFHLFESLWMLAGRNDARWLDQFVGDFSSRFAEDGGRQHGAYGFRWRHHFDVEGGGHPKLPDQLDTVVAMLRANPADRRAVITMWDPVADLGADKRDIPCNDLIFLRVREDKKEIAPQHRNTDGVLQEDVCLVARDNGLALDITVCCRSNDIVWGAYGANAVHFSILQEYLAARIGVGVGHYIQFSNNYHVYTSVLDKVGSVGLDDRYADSVTSHPLVENPESFDGDLMRFFYLEPHLLDLQPLFYNSFFNKVAAPLLRAHRHWKAGNSAQAREQLASMPPGNDWRVAAEEWMNRRLARRKANGAS